MLVGREKDCFAYLFTFASAHEWWLSTLIVDISPEIFGSRIRRGLRHLDCLVNFLLCGFIDSLNDGFLARHKWPGKMVGTCLELAAAGYAPFFDVVLKTADRVLR